MIKSAFDRHTCNISINYAINNFDQLYPQVVNKQALVLDEITRQAASLFAHDESQLEIPSDWVEYLERLHNANYLMQNVSDEITIDDIEAALCSYGADKAPGPSSLTVRHLSNSGVTKYLHLFLEESHCTKRTGHLFLMDKTAAFESVTYNLISGALSRIGTPNTVINLHTNMLHSRQSQVLTAYGPSTPFHHQKGVPQGGR
jgi:hypothetical protein